MASVDIYAGLALIKIVQGVVQLKLASMLLHPYPKVHPSADLVALTGLMSGIRSETRLRMLYTFLQRLWHCNELTGLVHLRS